MMFEALAKFIPEAFVKSTATGWLLVAIGLAGLIKLWPVLDKQNSDARAQKRAEKLAVQKEERSDLRERITSLEALVTSQGVKIEALTGQAQDYQLKLVSALAAFRLLAGELEKLEPTNPVLKQATDLISMASTGSMGAGMDRMLDALSHVPPVPERRTEQ